eukprot:GHVL01031858.1.p1 GENE.GHVL01031858.1~~GHVL01031858.1.p1  ORF type:complete len:936 (-),score=112.23 GHVL01031858.1:1707-4514(-)
MRLFHSISSLLTPGGRLNQLKYQYCLFSTMTNKLNVNSCTESIIKPDTDNYVYRHILMENNMQAMLVSDPKCDKSSASMDVGIGSLFDGEVFGLAHFLEHMLFLGTEKYPDEASYNRFLQENGGHSNAYTGDVNTCYHFCVKADALEGALDRFAQFFISPLFTAGATDRERQAVDSEYSKNLQSDAWRLHQIIRNNANPNHPVNRFCIGSIKTLKDIPEKNGIDIRNELLAFYAKWYSANIMNLCVIGKESLDELEKLVVTIFSGVKDKNVKVPVHEQIGYPEVPFRQQDLNYQYKVVPIQEMRGLDFEWVLPSSVQNWKGKPSRYAAHLIGHEGCGSLLSVFKKLELATELVAGVVHDCAGKSLFSVHIELTEQTCNDEGVKRVGEILFTYLRLLQNSPIEHRIFEEMKTIEDVKFRFRSMPDPFHHAIALSESMRDFPPEQVMTGRSCLFEFDKDAIEDVLQKLNPSLMQIMIAYKSLESQCELVEPWFGAKYNKTNIDPILIKAWTKDAKSAEKDAFEIGLKLPPPNIFLCSDFLMKTPENTHVFPMEIPLDGEYKSLSDVCRIFHKQDVADWKLPKTVISMSFHSKFAAQDCRSSTLTELWCQAVKESLNEFLYDASEAGLHYQLSTRSGGFGLVFQGWSDTLHHLLDAVAERMRTLKIDQAVYTIVTSLYERGLKNLQNASEPYEQCIRKMDETVQTCYYNPAQRLTELQKLTLEDLNDIQSSILSDVHAEILIQGNVTENQSKDLVCEFFKYLKPKRAQLYVSGRDVIDYKSCVKDKAVETDKRILGLHIARTGNADDPNNACIVALPVGIGCDEQAQAMTDLVSSYVNQKFYDDLRTKQQLGYVVTSLGYQSFNSNWILFLIQSEYSSNHLREKILDFFNKTWEEIKNGNIEEEFKKHKFFSTFFIFSILSYTFYSYSIYFQEMLLLR